jgi:hypothetical protein
MGRTACTEPQCMYKGALYLFYVRGAQISQKSRSHLKILGVGNITCSKFHTVDTQILGATVQNSVASVIWYPGLVHH